MKDPAIRAVVEVFLNAVALIFVVPIDHVNLAIGPGLQAHDLRPGVVGQQKIGGVPADEAGTGGFEDVAVQACPVNVVHEDRAAVFLGPDVAIVNQGPGVRVAASHFVGSAVAGVRRRAEIMTVVGDCLDVVINVRIEVLAGLTFVSPSLDHMVQVRDDARREKRLAVGVEVNSPGVAGSFEEDLEFVSRRMITPDRGVEALAILVGRAWLADVGVGENAVAAVEPAVGSPIERVQGLVRVVVSPAVEQHLRRSVGLIVAVCVGNEEQFGGRADPYASEADLDAADEVELLDEDLAGVEVPVSVGVFEDQNAVLGVARGDFVRIRVRLRDPKAAAVVDRERNRLHDVGLARVKCRAEAWRQCHCLGGFLGREAGVGVAVGRGRVGTRGTWRARLPELEVVEINVSPASRVLVDEPNKNRLADVRREINHHRLQFLGHVTGGLVNDSLGVVANDLEASVLARSAGDEETRERRVERERGRSQRPDGRVFLTLESANPELSLMAALHVGATLDDRVSLDRLTGEGLSLGGPVAMVAGLEVEVEHMPIGGLREMPLRLLGRDRGERGNHDRKVPMYRRTEHGEPSARRTFWTGIALE